MVEFLRETLARWRNRQQIRLVRADTGFFDQKLLKFLEARHLSYIVAAKLTRWVKREAMGVAEWRELDEFNSAGEFRGQLWGWDRERRFVAAQ